MSTAASRPQTRQQSSKATARVSAAAKPSQTQARQKQKSGKATARAPTARPAAAGTRFSQQMKPSANATAAAKKTPAKKAPAKKAPAKKTVETATAPSVQNKASKTKNAAGARPPPSSRPPSSSIPVKKKKPAAAATPASNSKRGDSSRKTDATAATTSTRTHKSQIVSDDSSLGDTVDARYTADDGSVLELHEAPPYGDCLVHSLNGNNSSDEATFARNQIFLQFMEHSEHYQDVSGESYSEVVRQVLTQGEHVGHEFIQGWADRYGDTIVVFNEADGTTMRFTPSTDDENFTSSDPSGVTRYIVYNGHNHFDYLLPIEEEGSTEEEGDEVESAEEEDDENEVESVEDVEVESVDDVEVESAEDVEVESVEDVEVESAEDYNDGGDILGEDGDEVGSVEEMYDNEGGSGELGDGMSPEYESDYNNGVDGYLSMNNFPDIVHEEEANGEEVGYSGSFESDPIPMPQERVESSPSGSPSERFMAAARSAASRVLGLGRRDLSEDFDAGRRRGSRRSSRPPQRFSPSAK